MKIIPVNKDEMKELIIDEDGIILHFRSFEEAKAFNDVAELIEQPSLRLCEEFIKQTYNRFINPLCL